MRQLVVGEINSHKTMSGQASRLGAAEVVVGDLDYSRNYFDRLRAVTPADLKRVLAAYLIPSGRTSVSINPAAAKTAAVPSEVEGLNRHRVEDPSSTRAGKSRRQPKASSRNGTGAPTPDAVPDFTETTLSNGARLLVQKNRRLPNLHLRLLMQGGPLCEEPGKRGSSALLATLLAKDTRRRSAAEIAGLIEDVGGSSTPLPATTASAWPPKCSRPTPTARSASWPTPCLLPLSSRALSRPSATRSSPPCGRMPTTWSPLPAS